MRKAKIADVQQARQIHGKLYEQLTVALETATPGITTDRLRRERDVCELHDLLLHLAHCQFEGRLLGFQYMTGGVGLETGRKAADLLAEGIEVTDKIIAWIARYPQEQQAYVAGWQKYFGSYKQVFSALETQVRQKSGEER